MWFLGLVVAGLAALAIGLRIGKRGQAASIVGSILTLAVLAIWAWLQRRPSLYVEVVPEVAAGYIERIAAVPIFMILAGIAWQRCQMARQRRLIALAIGLATVCFVYGSAWMLQATPQSGFAETVTPQLTLQTQDFSCVPASCATVLNHLGIYTTEAEMARLTDTRPGSGTTLVRAWLGLNRRLEESASFHRRAQLLEPTYEQLMTLPMPVLIPVQFESDRGHMCVLTHIDDRGVRMIDPQFGINCMLRQEFESIYRGEAIAIVK